MEYIRCHRDGCTLARAEERRRRGCIVGGGGGSIGSRGVGDEFAELGVVHGVCDEGGGGGVVDGSLGEVDGSLGEVEVEASAGKRIDVSRQHGATW